MLFSSVALKALSPCQNGREGYFCYYFVIIELFCMMKYLYIKIL